jgi:hypothetical protein
MEKTYKPILLFTLAITKASTSCFWCGQSLYECGICRGSGSINDISCQSCKGNGRICLTHQGNWAG